MRSTRTESLAALMLLAIGLAPRLGSAAAQPAKVRRFAPLPGQRILFNGDSIFHGYGTGNYTDPTPLRTVYRILDLLVRENVSRPPMVLWLPGVWTGLNPDGTPKTVDTLAAEIQHYLRAGDLRTGDWMIYEDAGQVDMPVRPAPWPVRKDVYGSYRKGLRDMVGAAERAVDREHIRFMTMFDYTPKCASCRWDAPLDDGVHTGNDAIRDEAAALGVACIDMNRIMDRAEEHVEKRGWGRLVGPDGIHPNAYGNLVMALAIGASLGGDVERWRLDPVAVRFRHPASGGDLASIWGFAKDPSDPERLALVEELRGIVAREAQPAMIAPAPSAAGSAPRPAAGGPSAHTFTRILRHGRVLDHPARQPEGTTQPASYELGKLFQLDRERLLLVASLREQGGHDFEIGNDGFVFRDLSEIVPERAIPINRLDARYTMRSGKPAVLAKYPVDGAFVPLGARLADGRPHPAAGSGFLLSAVVTFLPDRSEIAPDPEEFLELYQLRWDGRTLDVRQDRLPEPYAAELTNCGFNCLEQGSAYLCPFETTSGMRVLRFERGGAGWRPVEAGKPFGRPRVEIEPSIVRVDGETFVYTRGGDRRGRLYRSGEGLDYTLRADHWNHTVPQVLNPGLDGTAYLATNTGPGWLRNPLVAFALRGVDFVDPFVVHDEKQIGDDRGKEVPFCDHGVGANVLVGGRWRHLLLYRVLDLRETNGEGAPPMPQTGLYLAELEYASATSVPFRFDGR